MNLSIGSRQKIWTRVFYGNHCAVDINNLFIIDLLARYYTKVPDDQQGCSICIKYKAIFAKHVIQSILRQPQLIFTAVGFGQSPWFAPIDAILGKPLSTQIFKFLDFLQPPSRIGDLSTNAVRSGGPVRGGGAWGAIDYLYHYSFVNY